MGTMQASDVGLPASPFIAGHHHLVRLGRGAEAPDARGPSAARSRRASLWIEVFGLRADGVRERFAAHLQREWWLADRAWTSRQPRGRQVVTATTSFRVMGRSATYSVRVVIRAGARRGGSEASAASEASDRSEVSERARSESSDAGAEGRGASARSAAVGPGGGACWQPSPSRTTPSVDTLPTPTSVAGGPGRINGRAQRRHHGSRARGRAARAERPRLHDASWAASTKHSFGIDAMSCPRAEGRMRLPSPQPHPGPPGCLSRRGVLTRGARRPTRSPRHAPPGRPPPDRAARLRAPPGSTRTRAPARPRAGSCRRRPPPRSLGGVGA